MSEQQFGLGGRLPLLKPSDLTREQTDLRCKLAEDLLPWAKKSGFQAETAEGELLGPFNAMLWDQELGSAMLQYLSTERAATGLDATVREVVILTVGAATKCDYELYAHTAVAQKAGLQKADIDAIVSGAEPTGLKPDELITHRFVKALATDHRVPDDVYADSLKAFGHKCLVDMVHLTGLYLTTAALLNAFAVPVPK